MTRIAYDGITADLSPKDGDIYIGYVDGQWPSYNRYRQLFPDRIVVPVAVDPAHDATILDCETGDATPAQCPAWAVRQWQRGQHPTIYCNESTWGAVILAFNQNRVMQPVYWLANYSAGPVIRPGSVAMQYLNTPGYDRSIVLDYWPGVDPPPPAPAPQPHPQPAPEDDEMYGLPHVMIQASDPQHALLIYPDGTVVAVLDETGTNYQHLGCPTVAAADKQFAATLARVGQPKS